MNPLLRGVTNRKDGRRHSMDFKGEHAKHKNTKEHISHDVDRYNNKQFKESQATYWRHCELIRIEHE